MSKAETVPEHGDRPLDVGDRGNPKYPHGCDKTDSGVRADNGHDGDNSVQIIVLDKKYNWHFRRRYVYGRRGTKYDHSSQSLSEHRGKSNWCCGSAIAVYRQLNRRFQAPFPPCRDTKAAATISAVLRP